MLLGAVGPRGAISPPRAPRPCDLAARLPPDVVLLDIGLPGMSGYAVAERLRGSGAVLIATTGYGRPEDAERARQAGFVEHLVKPVDPARLRRLLADLPRRS